MPSKRHGYLTRKEWLRERLEDARDRAGAFDVARLLSSIVRVEVGPLQPGGNPLSYNGLLLSDFSAIEAHIAGVRCQGYETSEPFVSDPDIEVDIE